VVVPVGHFSAPLVAAVVGSSMIAGCGLLLDTDVRGSPDGGESVRVDGGAPPDGGRGTRLDGGPSDTSGTISDAAARDVGSSDGSTVGSDASEPIEHVVFVSSTASDSNLGGLAGADEQCQGLAEAAGLDGTFMAILSDSTTSARERLGLSGPVVLLDGTPVAAGPAGLWDGTIRVPIQLTETSGRVLSDVVWTGTDADGAADRSRGFCGDWGSAPTGGAEAGRTDATDARWVSIYAAGPSTHACHEPSRLYCIGVR
jgi:hypothetical protein